YLLRAHEAVRDVGAEILRMPPQVEDLAGLDPAELAADARDVQPPRRIGERHTQVQARSRHVPFERSSAARGWAHVVEEAEYAKRLWFAWPVPTMVPGGRIAAPHADAERVYHLQKRRLVARKAEATRGWGAEISPHALHGGEVGGDVFGEHSRLAHGEVRERVRRELLRGGSPHAIDEIRREVELPARIEIGKAPVVEGCPGSEPRRGRRARKVLVPVPAGDRADGGPRRVQRTLDEQLEQPRHDLASALEILPVRVHVITQTVTTPPAELEVERDHQRWRRG